MRSLLPDITHLCCYTDGGSLLNFRVLPPTSCCRSRTQSFSLCPIFHRKFPSYSLSLLHPLPTSGPTRFTIRRIDRFTTMRQRGASIYLRAPALLVASLVPICIARRDNCEWLRMERNSSLVTSATWKRRGMDNRAKGDEKKKGARRMTRVSIKISHSHPFCETVSDRSLAHNVKTFIKIQCASPNGAWYFSLSFSFCFSFNPSITYSPLSHDCIYDNTRVHRLTARLARVLRKTQCEREEKTGYVLSVNRVRHSPSFSPFFLSSLSSSFSLSFSLPLNERMTFWIPFRHSKILQYRSATSSTLRRERISRVNQRTVCPTLLSHTLTCVLKRTRRWNIIFPC